MSDRPKLNKNLSGAAFREWYWLKEELTAFLKENGLPATGSKTELADRIACFLDTGKVDAPKPARKASPKPVGDITLDTPIEEIFVCSEKHRAFFKAQLGEAFTFNVKFQKWLKSNAGKTYKKSQPGSNKYEDSDLTKSIMM